MQLAIALHAATTWYQIESDGSRQEFWLAIATYLFECADQPGVIDHERGGIIPRYSLQTPHVTPGDPRTASELIEAFADPHYNKRTELSDEGWLIDVCAEFYVALPEGPLKTRVGQVARAGFNQQKKIVIGGGRLTSFSPGNWSAWGTHYPCVLAFGWQQ